jgi:hypothetical protein
MQIQHSIPLGFVGKGGIRAAVLAHSVSAVSGKEIVTFLVDFPRFILPEFNTHRAISKCGASSRAIPVGKVIERITYHPVTPLHFGENKAGMTADQEVDEHTKRRAKDVWTTARKHAINIAQDLHLLNVHKQVTNRVLEPFSYMRMVVTATELDNFFWLRLHEHADPHINELARVMLFALQESVPTALQHGDYHVPFFGNGYWTPEIEAHYGVTSQQAIEHSMSCCAQTSYRKLDMSTEKTEDIIKKLFGGDRAHSSVSEHQATPMAVPTLSAIPKDYLITDYIFAMPEATHLDRKGNFWSNNFKHWTQHRDSIEGNVKTEGFDYNQDVGTCEVSDMFAEV